MPNKKPCSSLPSNTIETFPVSQANRGQLPSDHTNSPGCHSFVGFPLPRLDGVAKATGEAQFVADIKLPGMLYAKILRSPHPHAYIRSIDTGAAKIVPGVHAVVTGEDIGDKLMGYCIADHPPIARDKVRFVGEPVAAIIAETPDIAAFACEKVRVSYEQIPSIFDAREAMKSNAPIIHEHLANYWRLPAYNPIPGTNIYHHYQIKKGDIEKGFAEADRIFESEFSFPHLSHCQLEPHGCIAQWKTDGTLVVYASTQSPFMVRQTLAQLLDIPYSHIRVIAPCIGGGFGGKADYTIEPLTAYIAKFVRGRPVKLVLTREEMFCGTFLGRGCHTIMKVGVKKDGTITAQKIDLAFNAGAYGNYCINIIMGGARSSTGPYNIPNVQIDARAVYTNLPVVGAYRAYGHPEGHFPAERFMDIIAEKMGFDPVEFRLKNCLKPGDTNALGQKIYRHNGDLSACIKKVAESLDMENWKKVPPEKKNDGRFARGKGIAALCKSPAMATNKPAMAQLRFNEDCSVNIQVGATDMGQGSITVLAQIAAETLQIPIEKIRVSAEIDTEKHPNDWQTVASRTTFMAGNSVIKACNEAILQIKRLAAKIWGMDSIENIEYDGENVYVSDKSLCLPVKSLVMGYTDDSGKAMGGPATGMANFIPEAVERTFGCQGFDITVDLHTGMLKINKMVVALDVGRVINPLLATGQAIGAMVQGIGAAINEKIVFSSSGKILNDTFAEYKVPSLEDVAEAEIEVILLETPQNDGPYGARSIAEHGIVSVAPAFANAVSDALGIQFNEIPITPDKLIDFIHQRQ